MVDGYIYDVYSPADLAEKYAFESGVTLLDESGIPGKELLELSDDPSKALWQMGVVAVSLRDVESALVAPLLTMFEEGGPWHKYFVMKALVRHTPIEWSLAGELFFRVRDYAGSWLDLVVKNMTPLLKERLADGEKPSFGELLEKLDAEKGESLQEALTAILDSPLKEVAETLQTEFDQWRETDSFFTDLDAVFLFLSDPYGYPKQG